MRDLPTLWTRQMVASKALFGPGVRTKGVIDHIQKELAEVSESNGSPEEWVDVVILAVDGLTRQIWAGHHYRITADEAAEKAWKLYLEKIARNERRDWPDWRGADPDKAIEHVRGSHD